MSSRNRRLPQSRRVVKQLENRTLAVVDEALPSLQPYHVLIKVTAVSLNPTDYKTYKNFPSPGAIVGVDFAGIVVGIHEIQRTTSSSKLALNDRVCFAVHGSNHLDHSTGSFAEYILADYDLLLKIPASLSDSSAAAIGGTGHFTVCLALWFALGIPGRPKSPFQARNPKDKGYVMVYGASTATGCMALQILKLSGHTTIATCSPESFDFVKSHGADYVFDYRSSTCAQDIRSLTANTLCYIMDCISDFHAVEVCYAAMGRAGGYYASLELVPENLLAVRKAIKPTFCMAYEMFGKEIAIGEGYNRPADPAKKAAVVEWTKTMQELLDKEMIRAHPVRELSGGMDAIIPGLDLLASGTIKRQKLVVPIP